MMTNIPSLLGTKKKKKSNNNANDGWRDARGRENFWAASPPSGPPDILILVIIVRKVAGKRILLDRFKNVWEIERGDWDGPRRKGLGTRMADGLVLTLACSTTWGARISKVCRWGSNGEPLYMYTMDAYEQSSRRYCSECRYFPIRVQCERVFFLIAERTRAEPSRVFLFF
jgi:hypothetical protein